MNQPQIDITAGQRPWSNKRTRPGGTINPIGKHYRNVIGPLNDTESMACHNCGEVKHYSEYNRRNNLCKDCQPAPVKPRCKTLAEAG